MWVVAKHLGDKCRKADITELTASSPEYLWYSETRIYPGRSQEFHLGGINFN